MTGDERSSTVRDGSGAIWEIETIVAPASWATALVNNDWSGLELEAVDAKACRAWLKAQSGDGWRVIDVARDTEGNPEDPWFSWSADLHGSPWRGADLLTYVRERAASSAGKAFTSPAEQHGDDRDC
ncbi:hypothetical protein [Roseomonas fluvialis]|uniref:Uncharacterized protein n=1 Tax=Roseomonas fluvialis TaxID=1750527 RepID=A0ABN6P6Q5_9PROT|nr:hypothetical protein [Roseomonas fluvialis]BDG74379.1 hypothetical protein Rmf_43080 [Roseomonas fluvialis]